MGINVFEINKIANRVFPKDESSRIRLEGYLMGCRELQVFDYLSSDEYCGNKIYMFEDANNRTTSIYNNTLIDFMEADIFNVLQHIDEYIKNLEKGGKIKYVSVKIDES